jgi:hypothetical protein
MMRTKPNFENLELADLLKIAALAMLLSACFPAGSIAQHRGQKTFSSPEEACCSNTFHQPNPQSVSVVSISWASVSLATRPKQKELLAAQRARAAEHDEMSLPYQCCRDNHRLRNLAIELPYMD